MAYAIYADIACLLVKHKTYSNNPSKSFSQTISTHVPSSFATSVINEFKTNYHTYYRGEDCMKVLSQKPKEIAKEITSEEKHDMNPLTDNEENQYESSEKCHICEKPFATDKKDKCYKKIRKVKDHCHFTGNTEVLLIVYVI